MYGLRCSLRRDSAKQRRKMRRRKEGKVSPLNFTACSPGGLLASLRASSPEVPGGTGVGEGRGPQESLLAGYILAGYTHIGLLLFLDVLVQTRALRKERERSLQHRLQGFPLTLVSLRNRTAERRGRQMVCT